MLNTREDCDRIFNEQLGKLQTDRVDLYLLHSLGTASWKKVQELDILSWATRQKEQGRIGWIGFSFHDEYPAFQQIVDGWDKWDFCQIQYNYMNTEVQAGTKGLHYAAARGLAVVVMEPLLGGGLSNPPPAIQGVWNMSAKKRTPTDWALQWLWDKPEVSLLLSGMTSMGQLEENLKSAESSAVGALSKAELDLVGHVAASYQGARPIPCTQCNYCMPCPSGVNIPRNLALWNERVAFDSLKKVKGQWGFMPPAIRATACTACKECEEKCPQSIVVHEWMSTIGKAMEA
jgi:predicted aldo/keto reductase-like oxidoreductase